MISGLTIGDRMRITGYRSNLRTNGRTVQLLTDLRARFTALVYDATAIDPDMPLGADIREHMVIECLQDECPSELLGLGALSQVPAEIMGERVSITKREDNPSSPFIKFEAVKVV